MESNRCIVDSSVFVAFYRDIDTLHNEALLIMKELSDSVLIVHPYVIQETVTVLTYGVGATVAKQFLVDIGGASNIIIPMVDIKHDIQLFMSIGMKISFTDVVLVGMAKEMGARLVTFDMQMISLAKKLS